MKNFLEIIWTAWCLFIAAIIVLLNLPLLVLFIFIWGKKENAFIDYYIRVCSRIILILWGIRMIYIKDKKLDFKQPYIFVSNHRSYLDVFIAILGIKQYKKFLGKAEIFDWPIIGYLANNLGHIPVKRESAEARQESFQNILKVAKSKTSLFLCPEGAIYMNDKLLNEMRNGAFRVAIESQMPIVAITMVNAGELFPPHKIRIRPGKCINYMSAPFITTALKMEDLNTFRESVKEEILNNLLHHYPEGKYPIEFEPKEFVENIYQETQQKD